jgi:NhaA family Na+:H+ antiporter
MNAIETWIQKESSPGILLIFVTIAALFLQNSFLTHFYTSFLHTPVEIRFGELHIAKPLLLWVNDGLMAIFFFVIGLEVKREVMEGHLSSLKQVTLPAIAALGGMMIPALVFIAFNKGESLLTTTKLGMRKVFFHDVLLKIAMIKLKWMDEQQLQD